MSIFPIIVALVVSFAVTSVIGVWVVPFLQKIKFGQSINTIGPTWHKNKQGTPTMGGILFIIGATLGITLGFLMALTRWTPFTPETNIMISRMWAGLIFALSLGLIGFVDDYIKVVKKNNDGLSEMQKTISQLFVIVVYVVILWLSGAASTRMWIPFLGIYDLGFFYYIFSVVVIYATLNAVNFTDGIDGLCTSVTAIVSLGFMIVSGMIFQPTNQLYSAAVLGGCLGFFLWNRNPAKVFMGDTGSLFLGGAVVAMAYSIDRPMLIPLLGIVYLWEGLSVLIQRVYYKLTHKRIFKMTPIHHSFELSGYSENKIVLLFSFIALLGTIVGIIAVYFS